MVDKVGFSAIFVAMEDLLRVPASAIAAFERGSGLCVAIHDLTGKFLLSLPPQRFMHHTPLCTAVKSKFDSACVGFCANRTKHELPQIPQGRVQCCHSGLVEWVMPIINEDRFEGVLFAGQRTPGKNLTIAVRDSVATRFPWARNLQLPAPVEDDEAALLLEMLRQLSARLREWHHETQRTAVVPPGRKESGARRDVLTTRQTMIRRFIQYRHMHPVRLADLASWMHVSESRAGHVVRQACGASFIDLLVEARLKTAAGLLRHTNMAVLEVAARSGFGDLSHFHYSFRKHFNTTPHKFRRQAEAGAGVRV
jgi:AraC-like DNA-binding protein/ligand-binding sensor protein